jgi:hypothetical protein
VAGCASSSSPPCTVGSGVRAAFSSFEGAYYGSDCGAIVLVLPIAVLVGGVYGAVKKSPDEARRLPDPDAEMAEPEKSDADRGTSDAAEIGY